MQAAPETPTDASTTAQWLFEHSRELLFVLGPDNRFKLVLDAGSRSGGEASRELFDLRADPAEKNNLIAAHPAEAERLAARLRAWQQSVLESLTGADYR